MSDGGKGHKPRPLPNREQFDKNWADIFINHESKTPKEQYEDKKEAVLHDPRNQTSKGGNVHD